MIKLTPILAAMFFLSAPHPMATGPMAAMNRAVPVKVPKSARKSKGLRSVAVVHHLAGKWTKDVLKAAHKAHVSPLLVASVLHVENHGVLRGAAHRVSDAGAIGPMQLMPATALDDLHVNPWNPKENIEGGARYLARLLRRFHGNRHLALMAYNAGPTAVANGVRPECAVLYAKDVLKYATEE